MAAWGRAPTTIALVALSTLVAAASADCDPDSSECRSCCLNQCMSNVECREAFLRLGSQMAECPPPCTTCSGGRRLADTLAASDARFFREVVAPVTASQRRRLDDKCPDSLQELLDCMYDCDPESDDDSSNNNNNNNNNCETTCDRDPEDYFECLADKMGCEYPVRRPCGRNP
eukprot:COSAG01_NODE_1077_length_11839_cov_52.054093_9_plen_173_part_00